MKICEIYRKLRSYFRFDNHPFHEWKTGFEFFGSPASMYDKHTDEELGINIHSLNNAFCKLRKENKPLEYVTKTGYIIRKGEIIIKETIGKKKAID